MKLSEQNKPRRAELEAKSALKDAEFMELVRLSEPGKFIKLPNLATAGLRDFSQALHNFVSVGDRARNAFQMGFYVEVLALRSQSLELFLRMYLAAKRSMTPSFPTDDRTSLGGLIAQAETAGLDPTVVSKLRSFNTDRISGVHHYLLGASSYESLGALCKGSVDLMKDLVAAIAADVGKPERG